MKKSISYLFKYIFYKGARNISSIAMRIIIVNKKYIKIINKEVKSFENVLLEKREMLTEIKKIIIKYYKNLNVLFKLVAKAITFQINKYKIINKN